MKNRLIVLLAGLFLGVLAGCGDMSQDEVQGDVQGEPAQIDPQTKEPFCYACPLEPVQAQGVSTRQPVLNEKTGLYVCPVCPGTGYCGDGMCNGSESYYTCSSDCAAPAPYCGDGRCNGTETCSSCSRDCGTCQPTGGFCGDGICQTGSGENRTNCYTDCKYQCIYACPLEPVTP